MVRTCRDQVASHLYNLLSREDILAGPRRRELRSLMNQEVEGKE